MCGRTLVKRVFHTCSDWLEKQAAMRRGLQLSRREAMLLLMMGLPPLVPLACKDSVIIVTRI